jgi:hypothetical protein
MAEGRGLDLDDEIGDVLLGLGVVVVVGPDVVDGGGRVLLVVGVEGHPKYAVVHAVAVPQSCFCLFGPLLRSVCPWSAPLDRSPGISQLNQPLLVVSGHIQNAVGVSDDDSFLGDRLGMAVQVGASLLRVVSAAGHHEFLAVGFLEDRPQNVRVYVLAAVREGFSRSSR